MTKEELRLLNQKTKEWIDSEDGRRALQKALQEAEATKEQYRLGRRLPSSWANKRINI